MRLLIAIACAITLTAQRASAQGPPEILIFGGDDHKAFLGCLNCSQFSSNSIWNEFSQYGWYNGFATWNPFGPNKNPYGSNSACNDFAPDPPVLVDRAGNYYGRLTINGSRQDSVCFQDTKLCRALKAMCANQ